VQHTGVLLTGVCVGAIAVKIIAISWNFMTFEKMGVARVFEKGNIRFLFESSEN
jgi:hypothetical protein